MAHRGLRLHATLRLPGQAFGDEVDELFILASENLSKGLGARPAATALGVDDCSRGTIGI
jgi:hypothetical protein